MSVVTMQRPTSDEMYVLGQQVARTVVGGAPLETILGAAPGAHGLGAKQRPAIVTIADSRATYTRSSLTPPSPTQCATSAWPDVKSAARAMIPVENLEGGGDDWSRATSLLRNKQRRSGGKACPILTVAALPCGRHQPLCLRT